MNIIKVAPLALALICACSEREPIRREPLADVAQSQGAGCEAIGYSEVVEPIWLADANYDVITSACVYRSTWGWIDVSGILAATSAVDVHVVATVDGSNVGAEVQAPIGPVLATPVGGAAYVEPGKHAVAIQVYTGGPGAYVQALQGTWIRGEARRDP